MLPKEHLQVRKRKPTIRPVYRPVESYRSVAAAVIGAFEVGRTKDEIDEAVAALETHETFKLVRGLAELLERQSSFERDATVEPRAVREAAFDRGFVTGEDERDRVLAAVADEFDVSAETVARDMWADRDGRRVLVGEPTIEPAALLRSYNLSITQTLLFDARELTFSVSNNFQAIFGRLSQLGLMYSVDAARAVTVTGPAAVFEHSRKYGTTLAKLVPSIMAADEWEISAPVETEVGGERRVYEFSVTADEAGLFPERTAVESFDSAVERDFATRLDALADGWTVVREPTILRTGDRVMIPDFRFERGRGGDVACYLEVIGFWTPEYLREKLAKVRAVETEYPLVLAVDETLSCSEADFDESNAEEVFFYDGSIPVKPIMDRLNAIDERYVARDRERLRAGDVALALPTEDVVRVQAVADRHDLEPDAVATYLEAHEPGVVSNGRYVPPLVLDAIRSDIEAMDRPTLADVAPILERYGVAQTILSAIGFDVTYSSLDQSAARVRRAD